MPEPGQPDPNAQIASGINTFFAIRADGRVAGWTRSASDPLNGFVSPESDGQFLAVAAGNNFACAIKTDNTVACWGDNASGATTPPKDKLLTISARNNHVCGIRFDHTTTCWGEDGNVNRGGAVPEDLQNTRLLTIDAGNAYSCAIKEDQSFTCWGDNTGDKLSPFTGNPIVTEGGTFTRSDPVLDITAEDTKHTLSLIHI